MDDLYMTMEQAQDLARVVKSRPGWKAKAFLGLWPSKSEPGKYGGGWVVSCERKGDDTGYFLRGPDEWPILLRHVGEGEGIQPYGGGICPIHNKPYMPMGWPDRVPAIGEKIAGWECPECRNTRGEGEARP